MRPLASGKALQADSLLPANLVVESSYHVASNNSLYSRRLNMSKAILITGACSGFGRDTAETLRRAGHTVYASMLGPQGKNLEAAEALMSGELHLLQVSEVGCSTGSSGRTRSNSRADSADRR